ncbi:MAG TPA: SpoIID/LytB domain-containing protein [Actinomycetota bacterium]
MPKRILATCVLACALALPALPILPTASADAGTTFHFYGAGYGHGVGMSAYGVWGMAQDGWSVGGILHHFYRGVRIAKANEPAYIRVGLVQSAGSIPIKAVSGKVQLRLNDPNAGTLVSTIPSGQTYTVVVRSGRFWVKRPNGSYVGGRGWGGAAGQRLYARFAAIGSMIYLPQRANTFNRGHLELNLYHPCSGCTKLRAILQLGTESYVQGVGEEPSSRPMTMLKVFAIAARTYVTYKVRAVGQHRFGCNCGIWYVGEQFYLGYRGAGDRWATAASQTAGQMILYKGTPIVAAYSASDGGYTASSAEEWNWSVPYLQSVCDPGDYLSANGNRTWTVTLSQSAVSKKIGGYFDRGIGTVKSFQVLGRSRSGRIGSLRVVGSKGSFTTSGVLFAAALGLKTALVYINHNRLITGDVRAKYDRLMCAPGLPVSGVASPSGGHLQRFQHGTIYVDEVHGHSTWLRGLVLSKYGSMNGPSGRLGWPKTGVVSKGASRTAAFVHGSITCSTKTGHCFSHVS